MNILILWHGIPSPHDGSTVNVYHLLKKCVKRGHRVTLVACKRSEEDIKHIDELQKYCQHLEIFSSPHKMINTIMHTLLDTLFSPILIRNHFLPTWFYSRKTHLKVIKLLQKTRYDLAYCSRPMIPYLFDTQLPKVLDFDDPCLYSSYQLYLKATGIFKKMWWLIRYYQFKISEAPQYRKFDAAVFVSPLHKELLKNYVPENSYVIHYGVDIDYYKPLTGEETKHSLIFTGSMDYSVNSDSICHFCKVTYPLIKTTMPDIKLLIVGRNPPPDVQKLTADESIKVTGFVDDIRPFMARASIVVVPLVIDDGGFKIKILEAMAMSKAIVSTAIGVKALDVSPGQNIVIADGPHDFATSVMKLMEDKERRRELGLNSRKLVEAEYSWEVMTERLVEVFRKVAENVK